MKQAVRFSIAMLLVSVFAWSQTMPLPPRSTFMLEDATPVRIRINETVSSADAHVGDHVDFEVLDDVKVADVTVIPKGSTAIGTVTEAQAKRRMARGGKLNVNIDSVRLADGEKAALRALKEVKGGGHTGAMTGGIVATSLVFFPAAPFFLFMHGKDITIPKGTEVMSYINGNMQLERARFQIPTAPNIAGTPLPSATPSAELEVASTPPGADIELDGNFVGNTPSTLGIRPGEHQLHINKAGYRAWERKIATSTGSIRVQAELEQTTPPTPLSEQPSARTPSSPSTAPALVPALEKQVSMPSASPAAPGPSATNADSQGATTTANKSTGRVSITSTPDGAAIFVDSIGHGSSPAILALSEGEHTVQLVQEGYKDWVSRVVVKASSVVNVSAEMSK